MCAYIKAFPRSTSPTRATQEMLVCKVTKLIDQRKEESQEVLKGWFTVEMMKTELKWSAILGCIVVCGSAKWWIKRIRYGN